MGISFRLSAVAVVLATASATAVGGSVDLGDAGNYAAFATSDTQMTVSSGNTIVNGNVGVGFGGSIDFSGGGLITGSLDVHPGNAVNISGGSVVTGGTKVMDMSSADADASAAAVAAMNCAVDIFGGSVGNGSSFNSTGGTTVIEMASLGLSGGGTLTLDGSAGDVFIINVLGDFELTGGSSVVLTGGLTAGTVLFNVVGAGSGVDLNGNSILNGTLLATDRNITVAGGTINGSVIGCGDFLKLQSGPTVNYVGFVPAPGTAAVLAFGGVLAVRRRR